MINSKKLAIGFIAAAMCIAGKDVFAHTTIKDKLTDAGGYTALVIGHGCTDPLTGAKSPVTAQSVVFPTVNPVLTRSDGGSISSLSQVITSALGLAGLPSLVQDNNIFAKQNVKTDSKGNSIGFVGKNGNLQTNLRGLVPFRFGAVTFVASSCAKSMIVKLAVADICSNTFPPQNGTANLWIPSTTSKFTDSSIDGVGSASAALTITRNLVTNPMPVYCGNGYDVTVAPSNADVDANLPIGPWH